MRKLVSTVPPPGHGFVPAFQGYESQIVDCDEPEEECDDLRRRYRAIFISDLHLGTSGCQAAALLDFLRAHASDQLYLVGDIVDGWQLC